jgi:hypothetical protein
MVFKKLFLILTFLFIILISDKLNSAEIPYIDEDILNYKYLITDNTIQWSTRLRLITYDYGNISFIYYKIYEIDECTLDTKQLDKKIIMYNYNF